MSFILYLIAGFLSGLLGGMGMCGGTVLIPALTAVLNVEQHVAQSTNLIAFLPMSAFSLKIPAVPPTWRLRRRAARQCRATLCACGFLPEIRPNYARKYIYMIYDDTA